MASAGPTYLDRYSHAGIQKEILKDEARTVVYRNAILQNKSLFKDKTVLDVGCGTGILSMFAVQAGAKHVVGVDASNIIDKAIEIVETNGFKDKITLVKGKLEETDLSIKQFDIIISEWMGYFLFYDSILDTVLEARDKYLKPGGLMFPDTAMLYVAAIEDGDYVEENIGFWSDVYGFDLSCMKNVAIQDPLIDTVEIKAVVTQPNVIKQIDLLTVKKEDLTFSSSFSLKATRTDSLNAFIGWFEVVFACGKSPERISTGPQSKYTHWRQTIFYLSSPLMISEGESIEGTFSCSVRNSRDLDIRIVYHTPNDGETSAYYKMS